MKRLWTLAQRVFSKVALAISTLHVHAQHAALPGTLQKSKYTVFTRFLLFSNVASLLECGKDLL